MSDYNYKLNREEVTRIFNLIPEKQAKKLFLNGVTTDTFIKAAESRKSGEFLPNSLIFKFRVYLNKSHTIWMDIVRYYGGEHFGESHYFVGEIRHTTTNSAFSRFANRFPVNFRKRLAFTY